MRITSFAKNASVAALLVGTVLSGQATTTTLGAAVVGVPLSFAGLAAPGPFTDIFTFSLPPNGGSGYTVANFTLIPGAYNTLLTTLSLFSNPNGILFDADDDFKGASSMPGGNSLALAQTARPAGNYYINVTGVTNGIAGGIYTGAISVTAVPEPERYAMLLVGLGVMGAIAMRRNKSKSKSS
ncbi:MAG: FxDxF family PEP-CTERM protein [Rhodoferax sp.]|nr:FxDxF family PEP-CTERM protein [Rhodoferax sp.]